MLRKLLIISFLLSSGNIFAQPGAALHPAPPPSSADMAPMRKQFTGSEIDYKTVGAPLPNFILKTLGGKIYTNKDFQNKANFFLMVFNPTCGHCEDMTVLLGKNISLFNKSKIVLMANLPMEPYMNSFQLTAHTADYAPMTVGLDSLHIIDKIFQYKMLPQINIYDKDRKLLKTFFGDTPIDSLKQYIQ